MGQGFSFTPDFTPDASASSSKSSEEEWAYDNLQWNQLLENANTAADPQNDTSQLGFPWMTDFGTLDDESFKFQLAQQQQFADISQLDPAMDDGTLKLFEDVPGGDAEALQKDGSQSSPGDQLVAIKQPARKRGRPRKSPEQSNDETRDQRRRVQLREAQRAYRSRKEASVSALKSRIEQLESTLEQTSTAVIALSDKLMRSESAMADVEVYNMLRNTLQICLASTADNATQSQAKANKLVAGDLFLSLNQFKHISPSVPAPFNSRTVKMETRPQNGDVSVSYSRFIEQLGLECLQTGYKILTDPSISDEEARQGFMLPMGVMSRRRVAEYIHNRIQSRLIPDFTVDTEDIPFFRLGGVGTHFKDAAVGRNLIAKVRNYPNWPTVEDPLSQLPPDVQNDLKGAVFDMVDIVGYMQRQGVQLASSTPSPAQQQGGTSMVVDAMRLIEQLKHQAICLGRTVGFRFRDVEAALRSSISHPRVL